MSSAVYINLHASLSRKFLTSLCDRIGLEHRPRVGSNMFYRGDVEVRIGDDAEVDWVDEITISAFYMGDLEGVLRVCNQFVSVLCVSCDVTYAQEFIPLLPVAERPFYGSEGSRLITAERRRQVTREGFLPEHDAQWTDDELVRAAICYLFGDTTLEWFYLWPWDKSFWKPKDRLSNLIRAGALIAAEIDRLKAEENDEVSES